MKRYTVKTEVQEKIESESYECVEIIARICRNDNKYYNYNELKNIKERVIIYVI